MGAGGLQLATKPFFTSLAMSGLATDHPLAWSWFSGLLGGSRPRAVFGLVIGGHHDRANVTVRVIGLADERIGFLHCAQISVYFLDCRVDLGVRFVMQNGGDHRRVAVEPFLVAGHLRSPCRWSTHTALPTRRARTVANAIPAPGPDTLYRAPSPDRRRRSGHPTPDTR